jgi:hypothetical protein
VDTFFTSLNKRQTMLLLTATTFGGQEGVAALDFLPEDQAELLKHRAQEILQIPRERRVPALVQELKRLVKDRRGTLWSANPEKLAELLRSERGALVEVVLRALPGPLADAVRTHLPPTGVKLTREVRPQVLDIVRWKLEEMLAREGSAVAPFRFSDVLMMPTRELLTVCDRLGARVLGPAMAGLPEAEREPLIAPLSPDLKQLALKAVAANAPRKLPEEDAKAQLEVHGGLTDLGTALRSAGVHRLARACVAQSPEFAARMLERHRGDFGQLLARWVREERSKPPSKGDGGRTDIVADLERLAARGYIDRPVRLPQAAAKPAAPSAAPAAGARPAPAAPEGASAREPAAPPKVPVLPPVGRAGALPPPPRRPALGEGRVSPSGMMEGGVRRDPMAERAARRAGALSSREPARSERPPSLSEGAADGSRMHRVAPRREGSSVGAAPVAREGSAVRREGSSVGAAPIRPDAEGSRMGPPPTREGSRAAPAPGRDGSQVGPAPGRDGSQVGPAPARDGSRAGPAPVREVSRAGSAPLREGSRASPVPARDGSRMGPAPVREGPRAGPPAREMPRVNVEPARDGSQVAPRPRPRQEAGEEASSASRSGVSKPGGSSVRVAPRSPARQEAADPEDSRVLSSSVSRGGSRSVPRSQPAGEPERPPRVVAGRAATSTSMPAVSGGGEGTVIRRPRPPAPGTPGRGPRGGTR